MLWPGFRIRRVIGYNERTIELREFPMSQSVLALHLPADVYERVRRAAKGMNQPIEKALVKIVKAATPSLKSVPLAYRSQLESMEDLGDRSLWQMTESRLTPTRQRRLATLLEKNQRGELTERERQVLAELRAAADLIMLQRSYAYLLLKYRGHRVPTLGELTR